MPEKNEPVLRFSGVTMAFRLEAMFGDQPDFKPEDLVGQKIALGPPFELSGKVRSVEPYVDDRLGPGHWVILE